MKNKNGLIKIIVIILLFFAGYFLNSITRESLPQDEVKLTQDHENSIKDIEDVGENESLDYEDSTSSEKPTPLQNKIENENEADDKSDDKASSKKILNSFEDVAEYIKENGKLPDNFITKIAARDLGWESNKGNLDEVAPGKSIGGDIFNNYEGKLPKKSGRIYYECDINYISGFRGDDRIIFSNDGLIYKTEDHYDTFTEIK